jgi:molybdate transport system substrate-binding protein
MRRTLIGALAALLLAGCGSSGPGSPGTGTVITVFGAASLTGSFTAIGAAFERAHPGWTVRFNFAGSSTLATQINEGAPADVFAAASPATMTAVTDAGNGDGTPAVFARNQLVIAVPAGNPNRIMGLADLGRFTVALCAEQVPCGAAARTALTKANITIKPVTLEQDVKAALAKVKLGEVDAALVYRTDTRAAPGDVDAVEFPESAGAINDYPVVALRRAPNRAGAAAFVAYLRSDPARTLLTQAGFQLP